MLTDPGSVTDHQLRLQRWRETHPDSNHHYYDLDTLEDLKSRNDVAAEEDVRERPDVCRGYPSLMTIGNTHKCNLECPMCFKQRDPVINTTWPDLDFRCFEALAHEVFPHVRRIRLTVSGEPLLSNTIDDELELCSTYGVRTTITTNGTLLHRPGLLERLVPALYLLSVSMDAASRPVFEHIRAGASFDRVIDNIRLFNDMRRVLPEGRRPLLHFVFVLQKANVSELPQFIDLAHSLEVDLVTVDYVILHAGLNESDTLDKHRRQVNDSLERAAETAERRGIRLDLPPPLHVDETAPDDLSEFRAPPCKQKRGGRIHFRDWPVPANPLPTLIDRIKVKGGGNRELVEELQEQELCLEPFEWGIHQVGESLIPSSLHRPNPCLRPWEETYIDYDGAVAPCENSDLSVARQMGVLAKGTTFREIWNGSAYQTLRRSLRTGANFKYCHTCHIVQSPNEAKWTKSYFK